jgi:hypothetical protein
MTLAQEPFPHNLGEGRSSGAVDFSLLLCYISSSCRPGDFS